MFNLLFDILGCQGNDHSSWHVNNRKSGPGKRHVLKTEQGSFVFISFVLVKRLSVISTGRALAGQSLAETPGQNMEFPILVRSGDLPSPS